MVCSEKLQQFDRPFTWGGPLSETPHASERTFESPGAGTWTSNHPNSHMFNIIFHSPHTFKKGPISGRWDQNANTHPA